MAIATGTALLGAAVIGGAATAIGASKATKAANYAADQQAAAAREANALNERIFNQTRADNENRRLIGDASLSALSRSFGLAPARPSGAMMMSGSAAPISAPYARPATTYADDARPGAAMMTQGAGPVMDAAPGADGVYSVAPQGGGADWQAYLDANPDVKANAEQRAAAEGVDPLVIAQEHYNLYGKDENRALPMNPSTGFADAGPAEGYNDPTASGGYSMGPRPDMGPGPAAYSAPARQEYAPLDISYESYQNSPEFRFRMSESNRELDRLSSATGGRFAGRRLMAGVQRAQDVASTGYTDYRNYRTGQYNLDRARGDAMYSEDRGFGYGQARDARGDFVQDRSRSDGLYADDRGRLDNRYDVRNNTLLNMAGFSSQAGASNAQAGQTWAQQTGQNNMVAANARGDARIAGANAWNQGIGNLMTTGAYLAGSGAFGSGRSGSSFPTTYNI